MTTVRRILMRSKENSNKEEVNVSHRKIKKLREKRMQMDVKQFRNILLSLRASLCSISYAMDVSKMTLNRWKGSGEFRKNTNRIKLLLKHKNKRSML